MTTYQYERLPPTFGSIRLLRLLPSKDDEAEIRCELLDYCLHESRKASHLYEALSYVWGSMENSRSMYIGARCLQITSNLHAALSHLRDPHLERVLWVDAICINQANNEEKGLQIQLMAVIYGKARGVIVWLGETADGSDKALEAIRFAAGYTRAIVQAGSRIDDSLFSKLFPSPVFQSIMFLLHRKWFRRVWVLQEVAAARGILVVCGSIEIDGYAFSLGLEQFYSRLLAHVTDDIDVTDVSTAFSEIDKSLASFRDEFGVQLLDGRAIDQEQLARVRGICHLIRGSTYRPNLVFSAFKMPSLGIQDLSGLMDRYHTHEATQRHDMIYALLSMCSDNVEDHGISPNYQISWEQLLRQVVHFILGPQTDPEVSPDTGAITIQSQGHVIGYVSQASGQALSHMSSTYRVEINWRIDPSELDWMFRHPFDLPNSPTLARDGDIICLLEGAPKPSIVRWTGDKFVVIMLSLTVSNITCPPWEQFRQRLATHAQRQFLFTWRFGNQPETTTTEHRSQQVLVSTLLNCFLIVHDFCQYWRADEILKEAVQAAPSWQGENTGTEVLEPEPMTTNRTIHELSASEVLITEEIVQKVALAGHPSTMKFLLEHRGYEISITESILVAACINNRTEAMMRQLMGHVSPGFMITEAVFLAVLDVKGHKRIRSLINVLLHRADVEVQVTGRVTNRAAAMRASGIGLIFSLLHRRGPGLKAADGAVTSLPEHLQEKVIRKLQLK